MEENVDCLCSQIAAEISPVPVIRMCVPKVPVTHACVARQREFCRLNAEALEANLTRRQE
jgi:hypothetical protein